MNVQATGHAKKAALVAGLWSIAGLCGVAQDKRNVTEPVIPPVCIILHAALHAPHGIEPKDELWVDTERIQMSINHCGRGQAVELSSNGERTAFLSGTLRLRRGVTLLVDKDVTLYGSRNPRDYDVHPGSCGQVTESRRKGCRALIEADHAKNSGVMGEGVMDGRGGEELLVNGADQDMSWRTLAEEAQLWGYRQVPQLIGSDHSNHFTVAGVTLKDSAGAHVGFHKGNGLTVWGVKIDAPSNVHDADGVVPSAAKNITVADSYIRTGSSDIAMVPVSGSIRNVSALRNHVYGGQGIAIGAETGGGVRSVWVDDLSVDGADKGILLQADSPRGGNVRGVTYQDVCIRSSKSPILMDALYRKPGQMTERSPVFEDIVLRNVRVSGGGQLQVRGLDKEHHVGIQLDGVVLTDPDGPYTLSSIHANILQGPGPVNFMLMGEDSVISGRLGGDARQASCAAKFVPFPATTTLVASAEPVPEKPVPKPAPSAGMDAPPVSRDAIPNAVHTSAPVAVRVAARQPSMPVAQRVYVLDAVERPVSQQLTEPACSSGHCHTAPQHRVVRRVRMRHCRAGGSCRSVRRTLRTAHRRVALRRRLHRIGQTIHG